MASPIGLFGNIPPKPLLRRISPTHPLNHRRAPESWNEQQVPGDSARQDAVRGSLTEKTISGEDSALREATRGKVAVISFSGSWCGPCVAETPNLKAVWEALGKNEKFAMLGLSVDEKVDEPRDYAKENGIQWVQGFLGEWNNPAAKEAMSAYGVQGIPSIWLIGPDGKVVAKDLRGEKMKETVVGLVK